MHTSSRPKVLGHVELHAFVTSSGARVIITAESSPDTLPQTLLSSTPATVNMYKGTRFASRSCLHHASQITARTSPIVPLACRLYSASALGPSAISAAIKKDHRELEEYYNNIINAKDNDEATRWQNQFTWELARHSIAEELVVYPAFEKVLGPKGKEMADKDRAEHQSVRISTCSSPFYAVSLVDQC